MSKIERQLIAENRKKTPEEETQRESNFHKTLDKDVIKSALTCIYQGFSWEDSEEGFQYWSQVTYNLEKKLK